MGRGPGETARGHRCRDCRPRPAGPGGPGGDRTGERGGCDSACASSKRPTPPTWAPDWRATWFRNNCATSRHAEADLLLADVVYVDHHSFRRTAILRLPAGARREDWSRKTRDDGRRLCWGASFRLAAATYGCCWSRTGTPRSGPWSSVRVARASSEESMPPRCPSCSCHLQVDVQPGDRVITAGIDGLFPRGIPIGTITSVESERRPVPRHQGGPERRSGFAQPCVHLASRPGARGVPGRRGWRQPVSSPARWRRSLWSRYCLAKCCRRRRTSSSRSCCWSSSSASGGTRSTV